ncbi:hypothetical protein LPJ56_001515, partial [Coemansia sp. RSA 2599]
MSTLRNIATGPDEDEHYESRELGHPNKAHRTMISPPDTTSHDASAYSSHITHISSMPMPVGIATEALGAGRADSSSRARPRGGSSSSGKVKMDTAALGAVSGSGTGPVPGGGGGVSVVEQVRMAKAKAIEVLQALDGDSLLEADISQYISDVHASYNENDTQITFPKSRAAWTTEEDRLLRVGVAVYGPNTESWPRIAMLVPGRTNKSCRKRWFHSLDPTLHKGPWTAEEDDLLRQRVARYPSQWSRVAEGIPGRTDDQCAKRWRESLDPEIDRGKWRPEEDRLLLEKFAEFGTQWQKIATFFQGRPGLHCRNRWRKIQRIISQKEKKSGPINADDLTTTLASVTESVNKRKTAQRSRPHQPQPQSQSQPAARSTAVGRKSRVGATVPLAAPLAAEVSLMAVDDGADTRAGLVLGQGQESEPVGQRTLVPLRHKEPRPTSLTIPSEATATAFSSIIESVVSSMGSSFGQGGSPGEAQQPRHTQLGFPTAPAKPMASVSQTLASAETMGALYMPSSEAMPQVSSAMDISETASVHQSNSRGSSGVSSGAKRSNSVLYSPSDEQRLKLQRLGLKLYGCAASPKTCVAAFADPMSLNSHLKLAHPGIASLIPSLNIGTVATGAGAATETTSQLLSPDIVQGMADAPPLTVAARPRPGSSSADANRLAAAMAARSIDRGLLKPFKCAMPGCNHAYKNVNGLEYHIFQSRKGKSHLLLNAAFNSSHPLSIADFNAADSADAGRNNDVGGGDSGSQMDMVIGQYSPALDTALMVASDKKQQQQQQQQQQGFGVGASSSLAGDAANMATPSALLQCSEVECLATFASEYELRQHMMSQHPRPIRRATKPSDRAYKTGSGYLRTFDANSMSPPVPSINSARPATFWSTSTTYNDILAASSVLERGAANNVSSAIAAQLPVAAPVDAATAAAAAAISSMPTIPESDVAPASSAAAAAAIAAAFSDYVTSDNHRGGGAHAPPFTPGVMVPGQTPGGPHTPLHLQMMYPGITPGGNMYPSAAVVDQPFMSAPALMSAVGGEPASIGSYFSIALAEQAAKSRQQRDQMLQQQHQQQQYQQQLFGSNIQSGVSAATNISSMSPLTPLANATQSVVAASMMEAISQAVADSSSKGKPRKSSESMADLQTAAAHTTGTPDMMLSSQPRLSQTFHHPARPSHPESAAVSAESMQLNMNMNMNMQMMHDMLTNIYSSNGMPSAGTPTAMQGGGSAMDDVDGDVSMMGQDADAEEARRYARSQRSDSIDLTCLATVPSSSSASTSGHLVGSSGDLASSSTGLFNPNGSESPQLNVAMAINSSGNSNSNSNNKSGMHSQMAAALMTKRQQQATRSSQTPTPTNVAINHHHHQSAGMPSWSQDLSTLGFLPLSNDADISQYHALQSISGSQVAAAAAAAAASAAAAPTAPMSAGIDSIPYQGQFAGMATTPQHHAGGANRQPSSGDINRHNVIQCPVPKCTQGFNDANTLRHHLHFDHLRDDGHSNPGSPLGYGNMVQVARGASSGSGGGGGADAGGRGGNDDRSKAPHWVDPELWSNWIAAANGQDDNITAVAMATAMGVTPGVVGPASFLSQIPGQPQLAPSAASSSSQHVHAQGYSHYQHPTDN